MYYAVYKGMKTGIYLTWDEAKSMIEGYNGAIFKKFKNIADAEYYVQHGEIRKLGLEMLMKKPHIVPKLKRFNRYYNHIDYDYNSDFLHLYTDGGVQNNGFKNAHGKYAVFIPKTKYFNEHIISESINKESKITNNVAELMALIKAIHMVVIIDMDIDLDYDVSWIIHYDSTYAVDVVTGKKKASSNLELVNRGKQILKECKKINLSFSHVYSHTGHQDIHSIGNEIVDGLTR